MVFKWLILVDGKVAAESTDDSRFYFVEAYQQLFKDSKVEAVRLKKPKKVSEEVSKEMSQPDSVSEVDE